MRVAQNARLKRLCLRATSRRTRTWAHDAATSTKEDIVTTESTSSGTTAALVIVESYFGSTRTIAEAIAAGLSETGAQARVLDVDRAPDVLPADLDRLVLGAPTHNRGLPTAGTRATACKKQGATTSATGVREWRAAVSIPASTRVAAFDTVVGRNWLSGSAAKAIAKTLRRAGRGEPAVKSFLVTSGQGPLGDGEEAAARDWGRELAEASPSSGRQR